VGLFGVSILFCCDFELLDSLLNYRMHGGSYPCECASIYLLNLNVGAFFRIAFRNHFQDLSRHRRTSRYKNTLLFMLSSAVTNAERTAWDRLMSLPDCNGDILLSGEGVEHLLPMPFQEHQNCGLAGTA
jgi:hypothetical protein